MFGVPIRTTLQRQLLLRLYPGINSTTQEA